MEFRILENRLNMVDFQMLRITSGMEPLQSSMLKRALSGSLFTLSALARFEDQEETVGMLRVVGDGVYVFFIADLLVRPDARDEGIGTTLVNAALDKACTMIPSGRWANMLLVSADGMEGFYERLGFHTLPRSSAGHGMEAYLRGCGPEE